MELIEYLKIIRRRLWLIAVIVLISCITSGITSYYFIKPVYEASTKLIVNKSNEATGQLDFNALNTTIKLIDTYKEIIKTPAIMDKVVSQNPGLELTSEELIDKVKVSSVNDTQVMTLAVQDHSYNKAKDIVNAVSKTFQTEIPAIMKVDNVTILNEAKSMDHPIQVKPNPILNIILSFVVSMMAALGIVFLMEYLDDTIKTEEDIQQYLGAPMLAMITHIKGGDLNPHPQTPTSTKQKVGETPYASINQ